MTDNPISRNEAAHRFEVPLGDKIAKIDYIQSNGKLNLVHTEVPKKFEGQGIGKKLVKAALDYAQETNLKVIPSCPFVAAYIRRHPEYLEIVPPEYRKKIERT